MKSLASSTVANRAKAAGSWFLSQSTFGSVKPSSAGLHTHSRSRASPPAPARLTISRHSVVVRPSHHSSAGRITAPVRSRNTEECIWPEIPTAATSEARRCASTSRVAAMLACHHASGSCSAHPGRGVSRESAALAVASTAPAGLTKTAFTPLVPTSRPRNRASRSEEHTSELQSPCNLVCRLLLEKKKKQFVYISH